MQGKKFISLKKFEQYAEGNSFLLLKTALQINPELKSGRDYLEVEENIFISLPAAIFLIGRFALTDFQSLSTMIQDLNHPNLNDLPELDEKAQEWHDKIIATSHINARTLHIQYAEFFKIIYDRMGINFKEEIKKIKVEIGNPSMKNPPILDVISRDPKLRALYETTMAKVMANGYQYVPKQTKPV